MMINMNGPALSDFDFEEAARVFAGCKVRTVINMPGLQTPKMREQARVTVAYDWSREEAKRAKTVQAPIAVAAASGADISRRLIGSAISVKTPTLSAPSSSPSSSSSSFSSSSSSSSESILPTQLRNEVKEKPAASRK